MSDILSDLSKLEQKLCRPETHPDYKGGDEIIQERERTAGRERERERKLFKDGNKNYILSSCNFCFGIRKMNDCFNG